MRMQLFVLALLAGSAGGAQAQDMKSMQLATQLGSVLASEELCGLAYDQAAIEAFIEKSVKADDMGFASTLKLMTTGQDFQNKSLTTSGRTAHCAQIRRVVKSYGFTK